MSPSARAWFTHGRVTPLPERWQDERLTCTASAECDGQASRVLQLIRRDVRPIAGKPAGPRKNHRVKADRIGSVSTSSTHQSGRPTQRAGREFEENVFVARASIRAS